MKIPQTGGSFIRDKNGNLTRVVDPTQEAEPEAPAAEGGQQTDPPAAEEPKPKQGK